MIACSTSIASGFSLEKAAADIESIGVRNIDLLTIEGWAHVNPSDLTDRWELDNFGSLSQTGTGDFDNDGFSNYYEQEAGTDPTDPADKPTTTFRYEYDEHGNLIRTERTEEP